MRIIKKFKIKKGNIILPNGTCFMSAGQIPQGEINAINWLLGEGLPSNSLGEEGDFYINNLTYDLYQKVGGSWL